MAIDRNFTNIQGDDWEHPFQVIDVDNTNPAAPVSTPRDMTGVTLKGQIRVANSKTSTLIVAMRVDTALLSAGFLRYYLEHLDTESVIPAEYYYDLQTTTAGKVKTWYKGKFTVLAQVTEGN